MFKLRNKPLTKSLGPNFKVKWFNVNRKYFFMLSLAIWAPLFGEKKTDKGLQVRGVYGPMSGLKNKPHTKSFHAFF
jgi:hypothetical protein